MKLPNYIETGRIHFLSSNKTIKIIDYENENINLYVKYSVKNEVDKSSRNFGFPYQLS